MTEEIEWDEVGGQEAERQQGVRDAFELLGLRHVSASQIGMYQRCPRQWAFRYVLGLKRPPDGGLVVGSGVHAGAEAGMLAKKETGENPDREKVAEVAFEYVREEFAGGEVVTDGEVHEGHLKDKAVRLARLWADEAAPDVEPDEVESEFVVDLAGVPVVGRLDVVTTDGTVVDWKTTGRTPSVSDLACKPQTELYVKATGGAMRYVFLVDLKTKPKVVAAQVPPSEAAQAARMAESTVADTSQGMATGVWPRNREGWHCSEKWCGYYHQCMSGRDDSALAELAAEARARAASVGKG